MKMKLRIFALTLAICVILSSCAKERIQPIDDNIRTWYEIFVYSFADSDANGVGDINGVTQKLDYISDLGFNGIWFMPLFPSPTYHKYDSSDYKAIDPIYGTIEDFDNLMTECEKRNIEVIIDLALNHSSTEHPWFEAAVEALKNGETDNKYIGFYNFVKGKPVEKGYSATNANDYYYECMFWSGMPDFNLANENLRTEIEDIMRFWIEKGVAGFRLDAVKEFYSGNTAKNIDTLKWLSSIAKSISPDAYLVGENWDTTIGMYDYYKSGIDSFFDFPFSGANGIIAKTLIDTTKSAHSLAIAAENAQTQIVTNNPNATNASFFTNHDSPRAAGFMRRLPELIKTAWGINFMQTGQAFMYYGEELGMSGSGKDENKRAPMFWSERANDKFMCYGPPNMQTQEHSFQSAKKQVSDKNSIYNYIKKAIGLRNKYPAIARGTPSAIATQSALKTCFIEKNHNNERIVIAYNLSADEQTINTQDINVENILDCLNAGTKPNAKIKNDILVMPPYSISILQ